jgi:hypothetical protein
MEALIYFLLIASLFATMLQFGCSTRSKIPSPPGNAALSKAETFLVACVHCYGRVPRLSVLAAIKASSFVRNCQQENENDH